MGNQVYMGVDNCSAIPYNPPITRESLGRNSIWIESKDTFKYGLLIGDFAQ